MNANPFEDPSVFAHQSTGSAGMPSSTATKDDQQEALPTWLVDVPVDTPNAPLTGPPSGGASHSSQNVPPGSNWSSSYLPEPTPQQQQQQEQAPANSKDNLVVYMRLCNVAVTVLLGVLACISLASLPGLNAVILWVYIWFFGLLLCCFETHLKQVSKIIAENFGFLYHVKGRVAFLLLISLLCFNLNVTGTIAGAALLGTAAFNVYVLYKHPEYEQQQQLSDREQRGPASVTDAYLTYADQESFLSAGANWAQQNPDLAARAVSTGAQFAANNPQLAMDAANVAYRNV